MTEGDFEARLWSFPFTIVFVVGTLHCCCFLFWASDIFYPLTLHIFTILAWTIGLLSIIGKIWPLKHTYSLQFNMKQHVNCLMSSQLFVLLISFVQISPTPFESSKPCNLVISGSALFWAFWTEIDDTALFSPGFNSISVSPEEKCS